MVNLIPWRTRGRNDANDTLPVLRLRTEMDRLFDQFFDPTLFGGGMMGLNEWTPSIEIFDEGNELIVAAEVPGMDPDEIEIAVSGNQLIISGEKRESREEEQRGVFYSERRFGMFRRVIELPQEIDAENVNAEYDNGVLTIHLPKSQAQQPKRVQVKPGSGQQRSQRGEASGQAGHAAARGAEPRASRSGAPNQQGQQSGGGSRAHQQSQRNE